MHSQRPGLAASSSPSMLEPGDTLAERYRLDREVARTEAGVVFDALDLKLTERVAVEVAWNIEEPKARRKWARDAMLAQRLEGEHVLHVLDVGTVAGGVPYAVREVALCTMAAEIEVKGAVPIALAAAWTLEACEAIAEAHALGMAHGDLRLDNIYLVRGETEPSVKVAWTSTAKAERAAKEDVARDLASLGAILRVLLTGRASDDEPDGAPTLPSDLAHAVARALSIDPRDRIHNVAELARGLAPYAPPGHPSARRVIFMMSRAGIVSGTIPSTPPSSPERGAVAPVAPSFPVVAEPSAATDRASFTDEWFGRAPRMPVGKTLAPPRRRSWPAFALVSVAMIGLVLGGSWFLLESGKLPRWTGVAASRAEAVGNTQLTSAPATAAEPAAAEPAAAEPAAAEPAAATATAAAHTAPPLAVTSTHSARRSHADEPPSTPLGGGGLRYVDPPSAAATATTTSTAAATPRPSDESASAPAPEPPSPASPPTSMTDPVPTHPEQPAPVPGY